MKKRLWRKLCGTQSHAFQVVAMDKKELMHINDIVNENESEAIKYFLQFM